MSALVVPQYNNRGRQTSTSRAKTQITRASTSVKRRAHPHRTDEQNSVSASRCEIPSTHHQRPPSFARQRPLSIALAPEPNRPTGHKIRRTEPFPNTRKPSKKKQNEKEKTATPKNTACMHACKCVRRRHHQYNSARPIGR